MMDSKNQTVMRATFAARKPLEQKQEIKEQAAPAKVAEWKGLLPEKGQEHSLILRESL